MGKDTEIVTCASEKYCECFACKNGDCMILNDSHFENGICPFYKTVE
jgi:hypothetical protein